MVIKNICENKKNGIYYTPDSMADFLVKPVIKNNRQTIFDPAYGDGALLIAAEQLLKKNNSRNFNHLLFGCDNKPVNGRLSHLPQSNLIKSDFFDFPVQNKYDTIIMNPPYVRHYLIEPEKKCDYFKKIAPECKLKQRSDLWVYFLVKSVKHLKKNGSIAAILPWSFLQADYAQVVRKWLLNKFEEIEICATDSKYFAGTDERVVLVWLKNFGQRTRSIKISFSKDLDENPAFFELDRESWHSYRVAVSERYNIDTIIQRYVREYNFVRFGEVAKILIGVVTGADKFFILPGSKAKEKGFQEKQLIPILSSAKDFAGLRLNGDTPSKRLILFSQKDYNYENDYVKEGEKLGFHLRSHSKLRSPWYAVNVRGVPDAFFPYRMARIPYLMLNNQAQCTNSIHRVYFNNLSENEKKWIQVSLLAVPGQLSIENYSKTYGRGILKVEPGSLQRSIVFLSNDAAVNKIYNKISGLISLDEKHKAMLTATEFLYEKLKIKASFSESALSALLELQNRRLNK
ncbi:MAG: N-6 DNA methylase [Candidatus Aminicenantes bacterium]|nr:N-6 DNA methylase [Candidatus Aminicenantes bacterium]